jgi:glycosyltransferase involved in cell wall biosynthesis
MKRAHILVFEPEARGHQMSHVHHLLAGMSRLNNNPRITLLTTAEALSHESSRALLADFSDTVTVRIARPVLEGHRWFRALGSFYERQWRHAEMFARGFGEIGGDDVDLVVLSHLESIGLLHLALRRRLFGGKPWVTVPHGIRFHYRSSGVAGPFQVQDILQRGLFWWVMRDRTLVCLGTSDRYLARAVRDPRVLFCPDPNAAPKLSEKQEARAAYGIRPETCLILVFGYIDRRKCVDVLLESVARVVPDQDLTVLLAGAQDGGQLDCVMRGAAARRLRDLGRLVEINRFIDYRREIDPMSAADIVWVFYERRLVTGSAVLTQAGQARLPVIARRQGLVGRVVEENRLGLALSSDHPDIVAAALTRLARDPDLRRTLGQNGADTFAGNTPENFARGIVQVIGRTLAADTTA